MRHGSTVEIDFVEDEQGIRDAINRVKGLLREIETEKIKLDFDPESLDATLFQLEEKLKAISEEPIKPRIEIRYDNDRASIEKAIAEVDARLKAMRPAQIDVELNEENLVAEREKLQALLDATPTTMKMVPDAKGMHEVLARAIEMRRQLEARPIEIPMDAKGLDEFITNLARDLRVAEGDPENRFELRFDANRASLEAAIAKIDARLAEMGPAQIDVELTVDNMLAEREKIQALLDGTPLTMKMTPDLKGMQEVLAKAVAMRRALEAEPIEIPMDAKGLDEFIAKITRDIRIAEGDPDNRFEVKFSTDKASLEKALAELKGRLAEAKLTKSIKVDPTNLAELEAEIRKMQALVDAQPLEMRVDFNEEDSVRRARDRIAQILGERREIKIETQLDDASLLGQMAKLDAQLRAFEAARNRKVDLELRLKNEAEARARIAALARDRTVNLLVKVRDLSAFSLFKLSGLRGISRYTEEFGKLVGNLDRNLPVVAAWTTALGLLSSAVVQLGSNILALGNSLGNIAKFAFLSPAAVGAIGASLAVLIMAFKDLKAVLGDLKPAFSELQNQVSARFWQEAEAPIRQMIDALLPELQASLVNLAGAWGRVFGSLADALRSRAGLGGEFFDNLTRAVDRLRFAMAPLVTAFATLGDVGSRYLPRFSDWIVDISNKFNKFVQDSAGDGRMVKWIEDGITSLKDLGRVIVNAIQLWGNLGRIAQANGGATLGILADGLQRLEDITSGSRFQTNMGLIFQGAHNAMQTLFDAFGRMGALFDNFAPTFKDFLERTAVIASKVLEGAFSILASPEFARGLDAFLNGINAMIDALLPAAPAIASLFETLGDILGTVARDAGPLFAEFFKQLAPIFKDLWDALKPLLPALMEVTTQLLKELGPVLAQFIKDDLPPLVDILKQLAPVIAKELPVFADVIKIGIQVVGEALEKVDEFVTWAKPMLDQWGDFFTQLDNFLDDVNKFLDVFRKVNDKIQEKMTNSQSLFGAKSFGDSILGFGNMATQIQIALAGVVHAWDIFQAQVQLKIAQVISALGIWVQSKWDELVATVKGLVLPDWAAQFLTGFVTGIAPAWENVKKSWEDFWNKTIPQPVKDFIADAGDWPNKFVASSIISLNKAAETLGKAWDLMWQQIFGSGGSGAAAPATGAAGALGGIDFGAMISGWIAQMNTGMADFLGQTLAQIGDWFAQTGQRWAIGFQQWSVDVGPWVLPFVTQLGVQLAGILPLVEGTIGLVTQRMGEIFGTMSQTVLDSLGQMPANVAGILMQVESVVGSTMSQIGQSFGVAAGSWLIIVSGQLQGLAAAFAAPLGQATVQVAASLAAMSGQFTFGMNTIMGIVNLTTAQIISAFNIDLSGVGRAIMQSLVGGILSMVGAVATAAATVAKAAFQAVGGIIGNNAPNGSSSSFADGGITRNNVKHFASGGFLTPENHVAQIARAARPGMVRVWAEPETQGEAYIPYALTKRARSTDILGRVASDFGYDLVKKYAGGGSPAGAPSSPGHTYNAPVNIGTLITQDPDQAVRKLQQKRRDAMAVANIH